MDGREDCEEAGARDPRPHTDLMLKKQPADADRAPRHTEQTIDCDRGHAPPEHEHDEEPQRARTGDEHDPGRGVHRPIIVGA